MNKKLKVVSLFSGIGAFEKALENLKIDYELIAFSEIEKSAINSYCAIHNVNKNLILFLLYLLFQVKLNLFYLFLQKLFYLVIYLMLYIHLKKVDLKQVLNLHNL